MAESASAAAAAVIRKACDRCHAQKLSCRRANDEACERCVRLKAECRSSPSLRYKKQQQQQQQQQQHLQVQDLQQQQQQQSSRSPKRRRTDSDPTLVAPDPVPILPHTGANSGAAKSHLGVTPDPTALDLSDFNFTFDQLAFFPPQHLSHPGPTLPQAFVEAESSSAGPWASTTSSAAAAVDTYTYSAVPPLPSSSSSSIPQPIAVVPQQQHQQPLRRQSRVSEHSIVVDQRRPKHRPRQITLRDTDAPIPTSISTVPSSSPDEPLRWMAQLSDLNARLLALASLIPPAPDSPGFPLDEMFKLTRLVADILDTPTPASPQDPATAMLTLSTYVRLLDMYQHVFGLVRVADASTFRRWALPAVTVGSFAVESAPLLQMSLTVQLAEEFLARLRAVTAGWAGGGGESVFKGVVEGSWQAVRQQEEALAKHLVQLRSEIEALLDS